MIDATAVMKIAKYWAKCAAEGRSLKPFIVDVYGAVRADARRLILKKYQRDHDSNKLAQFAGPPCLLQRDVCCY